MQEKDLGNFISSIKDELENLRNFLKRKIHNGIELEDCKDCSSGNNGEVKLTCGHYMCLNCICNKRFIGKNTEVKRIECNLCEGKIQDVCKLI